MKKLFFAAIASIVMVSVSNAFAHEYVMNQTGAAPIDTVITSTDSVTPATEQPAPEQPAVEAPAQEAPAVEQPAQEAPAQEAPATETPAQETPATEAPAQETPATEAPAE